MGFGHDAVAAVGGKEEVFEAEFAEGANGPVDAVGGGFSGEGFVGPADVAEGIDAEAVVTVV